MIWAEHTQERKHTAYQAIWFGVWLGVTLVALYLQPSARGHGTHTQLGLAACPSVLLFDRPCPGCGLTTAFAWMVRGRVDMAFGSHALAPLIYSLFTASAWLGLVGFIRSIKWRASDAWNWILVSLTVVFLVYGIGRFALVKYHSPFHLPMLAPQKAPSP